MADLNRTLPLRKRADLVAERLTFGSQVSWVVKDPLSLKYFRFQEEEFAILELLDGKRSVAEMCDEFERRFPPQRIQPAAIGRFAAQLHEQGLVVSESAGQGPRLLKRRNKHLSRERLQRWTSPLAIRFRGIDPQRLLDFLYPWSRFLFSTVMVSATIALMLTALVLVAVRWDAFVVKLPSYHQFFTPSTLALLMAALGFVKVAHELGHGLSCRHFGGRCHELGLMLLVFTPCLYCNVTDSWRFPSKRHRIAVSAAGMYVELILASLATFGWWFSTAGLFHQICLAVMFVCSVSTVLFNGNPLLRYDGYFILADVVGVPNLAAKAGSVFRAWLRSLIGERSVADDPLLPQHHRFWFGCYHVSSSIYRWVLTFSIFLFLVQCMRPYHLENVVRMMGLATLVSMIFRPLKSLYRWAKAPGIRDAVRLPRVLVVGAATGSLLLAIFFVPLPKRVWGTFEIEPRGAQRVYVSVPGIIREQTVRPGSLVHTGDVLAQLESDDLDIEIAELQARCERFQVRLQSLERERFSDSSAALRIPELRRTLAATESQLVEKRDDQRRLTLRADREGAMLPSPAVPHRAASSGNLRPFSGRPHDRRNLGCALPSGTLYCEVGDPRHWEALIVVEQDDLPSVRLGMPVELKIDELSNVVFRGTIDEIAQHELTETPKQLSNKSGGDIATQTDDSGAEVPLIKSYQVRVAFDDPEGLLRFGSRGTAKIHVAYEALGRRFVRWCARTFQLQL